MHIYDSRRLQEQFEQRHENYQMNLKNTTALNFPVKLIKAVNPVRFYSNAYNHLKTHLNAAPLDDTEETENEDRTEYREI